MNATESTATTETAHAGTQAANVTPKATRATKAATSKKAAPKAKKAAKTASPKVACKPTTKKAAAPLSEPREGSKKQVVLGLLRRKDGATVAEIAKATAWQNHSIRGFISTVATRLGLQIASEKSAAGERLYRIEK